jgi:hypothetical protein
MQNAKQAMKIVLLVLTPALYVILIIRYPAVWAFGFLRI